MTKFDLLFLTLSLLPAALLIAATPYLTRKTEQFGVTIPERIFYTEELKQLRKKFSLKSSILSVSILCIMLFLLQFASTDSSIAVIIVIFTIIMITVPFFFYYSSHTYLKNWSKQQSWFAEKQMERIIVDTSFHKVKLTHSNVWFIVPLALFFASVFITYLSYGTLPEQIPTRFDFRGNPTDFTTTSFLSTAMLPFIQLLLTGLLLGVNYSIQKAKQQIDAANPEKSRQQNILFRLRWSSLIIGITILTSLLLLITQLAVLTKLSGPNIMIITYSIIAILVVWPIILSLKTGQGGSRINIEEGEATLYNNRNEDVYWKYGLFYFNRNDPSVFVEKRFGIGWSINFANPIGWLVISGILLLTLIIIITATLVDS